MIFSNRDVERKFAKLAKRQQKPPGIPENIENTPDIALVRFYGGRLSM